MNPLSLLIANLAYRSADCWRSVRPSYRVTWSWRSISQLPVIRPSLVVRFRNVPLVDKRSNIRRVA